VVLWGVVVLIGLPIAAVIAMVTLVGLPLGLGILLALGLIYGVGYVAGAWVLGRRILRTSAPVLAFLVGWGILRLIALVPILGGLVSLAATVVGLGAIVVALFTARRGRAAEPAPADVAPPAGPPPGPPPRPRRHRRRPAAEAAPRGCRAPRHSTRRAMPEQPDQLVAAEGLRTGWGHVALLRPRP